MEYQCTALLECTTQCGWEGILLITIYTIVSATSVIVGITLLVFILNKWNNFTVLAFTCIQVSMLIISIIIIIIQALVDPCACDPDNSTITINIWAIFVINYFVVFSVFTVTVVLLLLCMFYKSQENYLDIQRKLIFFILNFTIVVPIFRMMLYLYGKSKRSISSNEINPVKDKSGQTQIPHSKFALKSGQKASASVTISNDKTSSIKTNPIEATFTDNNKKSDKKTYVKNVQTPMAENGHGKADPNNQKKENTNKDRNTTVEDKQTTRKASITKH
ncbi:uncharacterized protein LOC131928567 [Physella acuta]|uniref:uncharacterized protein LOC131928567 n=1 Tax=Physella acuta TaxID=109671 RepID=UPI0027DD571F|nr:uncharacterized protein LOC131928567 [Physella acuta]